MNKIWVGISLICLAYGIITGRTNDIANAVLSLPEDALSLNGIVGRFPLVGTYPL